MLYLNEEKQDSFFFFIGVEMPSTMTLWKVSIFGVFLVRILPYSVRMRKNEDQKNSEYEQLHAVYVIKD